MCVHDRRLSDTKVEQRILRVSSGASVLARLLETSHDKQARLLERETSHDDSSSQSPDLVQTSNDMWTHLLCLDPNQTVCGDAHEGIDGAILLREVIEHVLEQVDRLGQVLDSVGRGVGRKEETVKETTRACLALRSIATQLQVEALCGLD